MTFEPHAKTAMLSILQETVGDDVFNSMMDTVNRLSESGIADEANALKFAASQAVDESTYDVVEAIIDEASGIIDENLATKAAVAIGAAAIKPVTGAVKTTKDKITQKVTKKVGDAADSVKTVAGDIATGGNYSKVKEHTKGYNDDRTSASTQEANSKYYKERSAAESKAAETSRDAFQKKAKQLEDAKRRHDANVASSNANKPKGLLGKVKSAVNSVVGNDANEKREISKLERGMRADGNATTMHAKKATELTAMSNRAQKAAEKLRASAETHRQNNNNAVQSAKKQIALRSSGAGALTGAAIGGIKGIKDVKDLKKTGADEETINKAKKDAVKKAAIGAGAGLLAGAAGGMKSASSFGKKHTIGESVESSNIMLTIWGSTGERFGG